MIRPPQRPVRITTPHGTRWCTPTEACGHLAYPSSAAVIEVAVCWTWRARAADFIRRALGMTPRPFHLDPPHPRHPRCLP